MPPLESMAAAQAAVSEALALALSLPSGPNREALLAGLQSASEAVPRAVTLCLQNCTEAEFSVLCRAMEAIGPSVGTVELGDLADRGTFQVGPFTAALRSCTALRSLG